MQMQNQTVQVTHRTADRPEKWNATMPMNRKTRLQAIKDRRFREPLAARFPSLGVEMADPTTCPQFVVSPRMTFAEDQAERRTFRHPSPNRVMSLLSNQFQTVPDGMVDPKIVKDAAMVFSVFKSDSDTLAARFAPDSPHRDEISGDSYSADAKAVTQCQTILAASQMNSESPCPLEVSNGRFFRLRFPNRKTTTKCPLP